MSDENPKGMANPFGKPLTVNQENVKNSMLESFEYLDIQELIIDFQIKHDYEVDDQFKVLIEETGELAEALLQNEGKKIAKENNLDIEDIRDEIGDIRFTLDTIAMLLDIDPQRAEAKIALENSKK